MHTKINNIPRIIPTSDSGEIDYTGSGPLVPKGSKTFFGLPIFWSSVKKTVGKIGLSILGKEERVR